MNIKLQVIQNRCLRTCLLPRQHIPTIRLHEVCTIAKPEMRRRMHLQLYMFKLKHNITIVNTRNVATCIHNAVLILKYADYVVNNTFLIRIFLQHCMLNILP